MSTTATVVHSITAPTRSSYRTRRRGARGRGHGGTARRPAAAACSTIWATGLRSAPGYEREGADRGDCGPRSAGGARSRRASHHHLPLRAGPIETRNALGNLHRSLDYAAAAEG